MFQLTGNKVQWQAAVKAIMNLVNHESRTDCSSSRILLYGVVTDLRDGCLSCRKWFEDHEHRVCEERDCKLVITTKKGEGRIIINL